MGTSRPPGASSSRNCMPVFVGLWQVSSVTGTLGPSCGTFQLMTRSCHFPTWRDVLDLGFARLGPHLMSPICRHGARPLVSGAFVEAHAGLWSLHMLLGAIGWIFQRCRARLDTAEKRWRGCLDSAPVRNTTIGESFVHMNVLHYGSKSWTRMWSDGR